MSNDPYRSPRSSEARSPRYEIGTSTGRPLGVTILSVFLLFGAGIGLFSIVMMMRLLSNAEASQAFSSLGIPPWLILTAMGIETVLSLAAGFGMLAGATWAWWVAAFSCLYSLARNIEATVELYRLVIEEDVVVDELTPQIFKVVCRTLVSVLVLLYLYKDNVRDYLGLLNLAWWKSLGILTLIVVAVYTALVISVQFVLH